MVRYHLMLVLLGLIVMLLKSCNFQEKAGEDVSLINTRHLDGLYEEIKIGADTVGIVHLYSEYPDYTWVGDSDEGIACIDDATRAAIFYANQYGVDQDPEHLRKTRMLVRFVMALHAPNGYFYNFVWRDGTINTDGETSKPEPNFWSARALWMFGEVYEEIERIDSADPLLEEIETHRNVLVRRLLQEPAYRSVETDTLPDLVIPTWLPKGSGTDQAAILVMGLSKMYAQQQHAKGDAAVPNDSLAFFMKHVVKGIRMMQIQQRGSAWDGAFLSYENQWHAYANIQASGLLDCGQLLLDAEMINAALFEIDHFYPAYLKAGGWSYGKIHRTNEDSLQLEHSQFPQIAYGQRPMIWAAAQAYGLTKDEKYLQLAVDLGNWFMGKNPAGKVMYDPSTGRGYDGINNATDINRNAGAESTIEALLSLQALASIGAYFDPQEKILKSSR